MSYNIFKNYESGFRMKTSHNRDYISPFVILIILFSIFSCKKQEQYFTFEKVVGEGVQFTNSMGNYRILILNSQNIDPYKTTKISFLNFLKRNGFSHNHNLTVVEKSIGNDIETGKKILKEHLTRYHYTFVYLNGTVSAQAARELYYNHQKHLFIFASVTDPVGLGLIKDFNIPPEANFTGVSFPVPVSSRIRFVKSLIPEMRTIGLIYADMPQSRSYSKWLNDYLSQPENRKFKIIYRKIPLIKGEDGSRKMALMARNHILELNNQVDVFISPNDQMGISIDFLKIMAKYSRKPLIGIAMRDVQHQYGAVASIFSSIHNIGETTAIMALKLLSGKKIKEIPAEMPGNFGFAFNIKRAKQYRIKIPVDFLEIAGNNIVN